MSIHGSLHALRWRLAVDVDDDVGGHHRLIHFHGVDDGVQRRMRVARQAFEGVVAEAVADVVCALLSGNSRIVYIPHSGGNCVGDVGCVLQRGSDSGRRTTRGGTGHIGSVEISLDRQRQARSDALHSFMNIGNRKERQAVQHAAEVAYVVEVAIALH